jgi:hypothetical protein
VATTGAAPYGEARARVATLKSQQSTAEAVGWKFREAVIRGWKFRVGSRSHHCKIVYSFCFLPNEKNDDVSREFSVHLQLQRVQCSLSICCLFQKSDNDRILPSRDSRPLGCSASRFRVWKHGVNQFGPCQVAQ